MDNLLAVFVYFLCGGLARRLAIFPRESAQVLNLVVIFFSLPALILLKVPSLSFDPSLLIPTITPWLMLCLAAACVLLAAKALHFNRETTCVLLLLVPLGNTSFLGIPMIQALLGEEGVPYALVYDQLGSFLALSTYGSMILAFAGSEGRPSTLMILRKIATFPPFIALVLAALLHGTELPSMFRNLLHGMAATLVPLVMLAVGFQLSFRMSREELKPLFLGLGIKMVLAPAIALLFFSLTGITNLAARVAILESGMPPMVSAGALAMAAGIAPRLTAALIGVGILVAFLTVPLLAQLL